MKKSSSSIYLKFVTNSDTEFLFDLLKERDPRASISHKKMPSYDEHVNFVKSTPYSKWYIIFKSEQKVGTIYLSKISTVRKKVVPLTKIFPLQFLYLNFLFVFGQKRKKIYWIGVSNALVL